MPRLTDLLLVALLVETGRTTAGEVESLIEEGKVPLEAALMRALNLTAVEIEAIHARFAAEFRALDPAFPRWLARRRFARRAVARGIVPAARVEEILASAERREQAGETYRRLTAVLLDEPGLDRDRLRELESEDPECRTDPSPKEGDPLDAGADTTRTGVRAIRDERPEPAACQPQGDPEPPARPTAGPSDTATSAGRPIGGRAWPDASPRAGAMLGKYLLFEEIGRGGMGVVYRALDNELGREVALKTLMIQEFTDVDSVSRLIREARTAGGLRHPAIIPVYDVGRIDDVVYYSMALVRGGNLRDALEAGRFPDLRSRVQVLHSVADGVAVAHETGVIHRDLKPANVLLGEGDRILIADFGLAKSLGTGTRLTATGHMMGTPHYMPPEQIRGDLDRMGPPTDVYALGVMLYELLAGRAPFEATAQSELFNRVLRDEPPSPRAKAPHVPIDLETICLRALRKEPEARYSSAREFCEELGRFLRGEAIHSRPERAWERGGRWIRRNPWPAGVVLAAIGMAGLAYGSARQARAEAEAERAAAEHGARVNLERERAADALRSMLREKASVIVDTAIKLRRQGVSLSLAERYFERLREAAEAVAADDPSSAEPHFHLGRMYRALSGFRQALEQQETALGKEPSHVGGLQEHLLLTLRLHAARLQDLRHRWWWERTGRLDSVTLGSKAARAADREGPPSDRELMSADPEARRLQGVLTAGLERLERIAAHAQPPVLPEGRLACLRALVRVAADPAAGGADEGVRLLQACVRDDPGLEEAWLTLGRIRENAGDAEGAVALYTRALAFDRGYAPFLEARAHALRQGGILASEAGRTPADRFAAAQEDLTRAIALDSKGTVRARAILGHLLNDWGVWEGEAGGDGEGRLQQAETVFAGVRDLDPGSVFGWIGQAIVQNNRAILRAMRGEDPLELLQSADGAASRAIGMAPSERMPWRARANARRNLGLACARHGRDGAESWFEGAESDLTEALRRAPDDAHALADRSRLRSQIARMWTGDYTIRAAAALEDAGQAIAIDPNLAEAWLARAIARATQVRMALLRATVAPEDFDAAEADFTRALELNPSSVDALRERALLRTDRGNRIGDLGGDPSAAWAGAEADLERAAALEPRNPLGNWLAGRLQRARAMRDHARGVDPEPRLAQAEAELDRALKTDSTLSGARIERCGLRLDRGAMRAQRGRDPLELWTAAEADLEQALVRAPRDPEAWRLRGFLNLARGQFAMGTGKDPTESFRLADADFTRAVDCAPEYFLAWENRGQLAVSAAAYAQMQGQPSDAPLQAAEASLLRALQLKPGSARVQESLGATVFLRAEARRNRGENPAGDFERAGKYLEEAVRLAPRSLTAWTTLGELRSAMASHARSCGEESVPWLARAATAFQHVTEVNPRDPGAWLGVGGVWLRIAQDDLEMERDPEVALDRADSALAKAVSLHPKFVHAWSARGRLSALRGTYLRTRGQDPTSAYRAGDEYLTRALEIHSGFRPGRSARVDLQREWAAYEWSRGGDPSPRLRSALRDAETLHSGDPASRVLPVVVAEIRASLAAVIADPARREVLLLIGRGLLRFQSGDHAGARTCLEEAMRASAGPPEGTGDTGDTDVRLVASSHAILARILARAAVGKGAPYSPPTRVTPTEAGKLLDEAFHHVDRAIECGAGEWSPMAQDPDLAGLRADPRWSERSARIRSR